MLYNRLAMRDRYVDQPVSASTAYAQLHTAALAVELARDVSHLNGSFGVKRVKGTQQWYFSFRDIDGRVRQLYVGPDNDGVRDLVRRARAAEPAKPLRTLAKSALVLGCTPTQRKHLGVILRLNEFGFFRAGGVLVGTHAFIGYANALGVRWKSGEQTSDVDFAHAGRNVSIALPTDIRAEPHAALTTMEAGFLPILQYRGAAGASYRHPQEPEFQVDFLTPKTSESDEPIAIERLDVALQPLRFMEFVLEKVQQVTLFDPTGRAAVVSVPAPERYAVHKLLVMGERSSALRAKADKDLAQALALLEYFEDADPDSAREAWDDALRRGRGWQQRLTTGLRAMQRAAPDLAAALAPPKG